MNAPLKPKPMTVDEFIPWALAQPRGRFELFNGEVVAMNAERARHLRGKARVLAALTAALKAAGLEGEVMPDGATVRINARTAFEPDALVYLGLPVDDDVLEIPNPIVVVEVVSPSSSAIDSGTKLAGYFSVPSVMHYLIVDPLARKIAHHRRDAGGQIMPSEHTDGLLSLDPPGIHVAIVDMLPPA